MSGLPDLDLVVDVPEELGGPNDIGSSSLAVVEVKSVNFDGLATETSHELLTQVRDRIEHVDAVLSRGLFQSLLPIADTLARARSAYELETGTGKGKRNPNGVRTFVDVAAEALDRSASFVERLLKLAQLDEQTRALMADVPRLAGNQDALLALAREPLPHRRHMAVEAFVTGGRSGMSRVLDSILIDEPVDLDDERKANALSFLEAYGEAKRAKAEARGRNRPLDPDSPTMVRRRAAAKAVFDYLRSGETALDEAALERIGISDGACKRAVEDLQYANMIESGGRRDCFEAVDGRDMTYFEAKPNRKALVQLLVAPSVPVTQRLKGGNYEIVARVVNNSVTVIMREV